MKQNMIIGVLSSVMQLTHPVQQGLHYAKEVVFIGLSPDADLPPVGRGKAVRGGSAGGRVAGRIAMMWGSDRVLCENLSSVPRRCVVAMVTSGSGDLTVARLRDLQAAGYEVHICPPASRGAIRAIASDIARTQVQCFFGGAWHVVDTALPDLPVVASDPDLSKSSGGA